MLVSGVSGGGSARTSSDGLILPSAFPARGWDLDTSKVNGSADDLRAMGKAVDEKVGDIDEAWSGLRDHYQAPEQDRVYALMDPAVDSASDLKSTVGKAAGHLDTYASTLEGIKPRLKEFERRAWDFRYEVQHGVVVEKTPSPTYRQAGVPGTGGTEVIPWNEDEDTVAKNEALLNEYAGLLEEVSLAVATCANDINALIEGRCVGVVQATPAEAFTDPHQPMPWGSPVAEEKSCGEATGAGVARVPKELVQSVLPLVVGYNPGTDEDGFSFGDLGDGSTYAQAWGGMADFYGATGVMVGAGVTKWGYSVVGREAPAWTTSAGTSEKINLAAAGWSSVVLFDYQAAVDPEDGKGGWHEWEEKPVESASTMVTSLLLTVASGGGYAAGKSSLKGALGARRARGSTDGPGQTSADVLAGLEAAGGAEGLIAGGWAQRLGTVFPGGPFSVKETQSLLDAVDDVPAAEAPKGRTPVSETIFDGDRAASGEPSGDRLPEQSVTSDASLPAGGDGAGESGSASSSSSGSGDRVPESVGVGARSGESEVPESSVTSDVSGEHSVAERADVDGASEGGAARSGSSEGPVARDGSPAAVPVVRPDVDGSGSAGVSGSSGAARAGDVESSSSPAGRDGAGESGSASSKSSGGDGSASGGSGAAGGADAGAPTQFAHEQVDLAPADETLSGLLDEHGMSRADFKEALMEPVPLDPAELTPEQQVLRDIRAELGAPQAGEAMQKVLTPADYENYMSGRYPTIQGSVTRLEDGVVMDTPAALHDGLRLDFGKEPRPFSRDAEEVMVMRFTSDTDAKISAYSSMGGRGATDDWVDPYSGNGFIKSTDRIVPESTLPGGSSMENGAEIWAVRTDGSEVLDAIRVNDKWVKVR